MKGNDTPELGELKRVGLREKWPNEEQDFTPWLADNIGYLEDEDILSMGIEVRETEANIKGYYADIHATDIEGERDIIIENQYGSADYSHLGKAQLYAAGYGADIVVWIAENFDDAHVDTIQWLNERTNNETGFFAIKTELYQIEDSDVAISFSVVERPSTWKQLTGDLNETERQHLQFWKGFENKLEERDSHKFIKGKQRPTASYGIPDDLNDASIRLARSVRGNLECAIRITDRSGNLAGLDEDEVIAKLEQKVSDLGLKTLSESEIEDIEISRRPEKKYDRITLYYPDEVNPGQQGEWPTHYDWLVDATIAFDEAFSEYFE